MPDAIIAALSLTFLLGLVAGIALQKRIERRRQQSIREPIHTDLRFSRL